MSAPYAAGGRPDAESPDDGRMDDDHLDDEGMDDDRMDDHQMGDDRMDDHQMGDDLPEFAAAVLDVVDLVPPGQVVSYGDIAALLGRGGPRQVGQVMAHFGGAVAWWRVLRADGSPPQGHVAEALTHYHRERTPMRPGGDRVDLRKARWPGPT